MLPVALDYGEQGIQGGENELKKLSMRCAGGI